MDVLCFRVRLGDDGLGFQLQVGLHYGYQGLTARLLIFVCSYGIFQGWTISVFRCVSGADKLWIDFYTSHPPFNTSSGVTIAAIGTVALALEYGEVGVL